MRRTWFLIAALAAVAAPAGAQFGKSVSVKANTPEDKALVEIYSAADPAQKIALLDKFMAEFGKGDLELLGDELYATTYSAQKNYDKAFEYGDKALALDPDSLDTAVTLARAAQEKGDLEREYQYGEKIVGILARFQARPVPEGGSESDWAQQKADALAKVKDDVNYVEYAMYAGAVQLNDPTRKAALLERFVAAVPDSPYAENAQAVVAASYQQLRDYAKMLEFAKKVLARDPNNIGMNLLLADYWSEKGEQFDQAEAAAKKALEQLAAAKKPDQMTDDQWQQQLGLQKGIANSALGQIYVNRNQNAQAVAAFKQASPLLKSNPINYARNLYRLGFTLAKMQRIPEARATLTEAVSINSPYRALAQQTLDKIGGSTRRRRD
jgi:tetratricopeptide (TPR) repeat protein